MTTILRLPPRPELRAAYRLIAEPGYGTTYDTAALPDRLYGDLDDARRPPSVMLGTPEIDAERVDTPLSVLLRQDAPAESWPKEATRALQRLEALWLLLEDRHRLLDTSEVEPLAHQVSLVEHVLSSEDLRHVLIADEVGLGKTIEAGQLLRRFEERADRPLRMLYLTQARLVDNVVEELQRLGVRAQIFGEVTSLDGSLRTAVFVASIHKAVHPRWFDVFAASGPWDVLVVDEAHHLKDYGEGALRQMELVRKLSRERLTPAGRLILMTGTPHQGHEGAFRNLLRLLSDNGKDEREARGRIIYRIKDDILDWDGSPLFPPRHVHPPTPVQVGPAYQAWMEEVRQLLAPRQGSRPSAWRQAQALQWCASSPEAGLAYLVRLAMRAGHTAAGSPSMREALLALRPYRGGGPTEDVLALEQRIRAGVTEDEDLILDQTRLVQALSAGAALVQENAFQPKLEQVLAWMREAPEEKFVVFAQPVETVYLLKRHLSRETGVSVILGGQSNDERRREIERFREERGVRVLVSSRSGGEGINLQVARRLIHFDVPWNPMEMEQRVGRVHRFGSALTVLVDTLVLEDSREQRVLERCRAKLGGILAQMVGTVDEERFARFFSRTMAQIPTEELEELMTREGFGTLAPSEEDRLDSLVQDGFAQWQKLDRELRSSRSVQSLDRGPIGEQDLAAFLTGVMGAKKEDGWRKRRLDRRENGACELVESPAEVYRLPDGSLGYVGTLGGIGLAGPEGEGRPHRLGLNHPLVMKVVRECVGGSDPRGKGESAWVRGTGFVQVPLDDWRGLCARHHLPEALASGGLLTAHCARFLEMEVGAREIGSMFSACLMSPDGEASLQLPPEAAADLIRLLRRAKPGHARSMPDHAARLLAREVEQIEAMRKSRPGAKIRAAVFPLAALWLTPSKDMGGEGITKTQDASATPEVPEGTYKALSIKQPYAELIMQGVKDVENRTWQTEHRGPLLIHASRMPDEEGLRRYGFKEGQLPNGALLGVVDVVDCTLEMRSRWHEEGCYGFYLKNPRRFPRPIGYSGQLRLFPVPEAALGGAIRQLGGSTAR